MDEVIYTTRYLLYVDKLNNCDEWWEVMEVEEGVLLYRVVNSRLDTFYKYKLIWENEIDNSTFISTIPTDYKTKYDEHRSIIRVRWLDG
jgi:hypothetical protein